MPLTDVRLSGVGIPCISLQIEWLWALIDGSKPGECRTWGDDSVPFRQGPNGRYSGHHIKHAMLDEDGCFFLGMRSPAASQGCPVEANVFCNLALASAPVSSCAA